MVLLARLHHGAQRTMAGTRAGGVPGEGMREYGTTRARFLQTLQGQAVRHGDRAPGPLGVRG